MAAWVRCQRTIFSCQTDIDWYDNKFTGLVLERTVEGLYVYMYALRMLVSKVRWFPQNIGAVMGKIKLPKKLVTW